MDVLNKSVPRKPWCLSLELEIAAGCGVVIQTILFSRPRWPQRPREWVHVAWLMPNLLLPTGLCDARTAATRSQNSHDDCGSGSGLFGAREVVMTAHNSPARPIGVACGTRKGLVLNPRPRTQAGHVFLCKLRFSQYSLSLHEAC